MAKGNVFFNGKVYANKGLASAAQKKAAQNIIDSFVAHPHISDEQAAYENAAQFVAARELAWYGRLSLGKWVFFALNGCHQIAAKSAAERLKVLTEKRTLKAAKVEKERQRSIRAAKMAVRF